MQGSVRLYQKHIQQTAFSGCLLPWKADSPETVQTDQCIYSHILLSSPLILHRFCSFYKYTPLWRRKNMHYIRGSNSRVHGLHWRPCSPRWLVPCDFKWPQIGAPTFILFLTAAHVKLNQWLLILARMRWHNGKAVPLLGPTPGFSFLRLVGKAGLEISLQMVKTPRNLTILPRATALKLSMKPGDGFPLSTTHPQVLNPS